MSSLHDDVPVSAAPRTPAPSAAGFPTASTSLQRFDAYRLAVAFRRHVIRWLPLRRPELSDQLDRASISVVLNIAEAVGRTTPRDQARTFAIARGSAIECAAILDLLELESTNLDLSAARETLGRVCAMLTRLVLRR